MNPLIRSYKFAVVVFVVVSVLGGWWFFHSLNKAVYAKYARVWMRDALLLANQIERFHEVKGHYPVAFDDPESLRPQLGPGFPLKWSLFDDDDRQLRYYSDGSHYTIILVPAGDGPLSPDAYFFVIRDGQWTSWPSCLPTEKLAKLQIHRSGEVPANSGSQSN